MNFVRLIFSVLVISLSVNTAVKAADPARGAELYKKCIACHGDQGQGNPKQKAPILAGQKDWYIVSSLLKFKSKERKNPVMMPFIKNLGKADFEDLASYISSL